YARIAELEAENARLRDRELALSNEVQRLRPSLSEAIEQQAATADILRVIAASSADLQAVILTLAESAVRVCGAQRIAIYQRDGDIVRRWDLSRQRVEPGTFWDDRPDGSVPLTRDFVAGRAVLDCRTIQVADLLTATQYPLGQQMAASLGHRTTLA